MGGLASASMGVKYSPIVLPCWRDVAVGSDFLKDLHAWSWPQEIPYHLVFSYVSGDSGDGVVPLESQIPPHLQDEAVRMYGFNHDHVGTLDDPRFLALFNQILHDRSQARQRNGHPRPGHNRYGLEQ
jgi:hypothetical protein